jgi:hypothetical protein
MLHTVGFLVWMFGEPETAQKITAALETSVWKYLLPQPSGQVLCLTCM